MNYMMTLHVIDVIDMNIAFPTMAAIINKFDGVSPFAANP